MNKPGCILIVDDEPRNLSLLEGIIHPMGYETKSASSGFEALEKLDSTIDLVLLDVLMPGMDGFEVLHLIRETKGFGDLPVIAVTALNGRNDRLRAIQLGANDFISKPIDITELRVRIESLMRMKKARDALRHSEERYRTMVQTARDVIWTMDLDFRYTYVSPSISQKLF